jgi:hypothetical protein
MSRQRARHVPSWVDDSGLDTDWESAGTIGGSARAQAAASVVLRYGLWGGIVLALVLGLVNCAGSQITPPAPVSAAADPPPVAPPGGCAELLVAAWLAGDVELLSEVAGVPRGQVEPGRRQALRTYTAAVTPGQVPSDASGDSSREPAGELAGEPNWGFLIGAEVQVRDEEGRWRDAGVQFFSVTLVPATDGCGGWRPAALPAQVAAPQLASPELAYPVSIPVSGNDLSDTLQAFFAGMLTGEGSPERYVAPGSVVPFPAPAPYQQVSITDLQAPDDAPIDRTAAVPPDGTILPLLVTVATDPEDLPLVYPVTVGVRGGRWEVVAIEPLIEKGD